MHEPLFMMQKNNMNDHAKFIVFEGIDGTGKTTIVKILSKELKRMGYRTFVTEEPTKTWIGEDVRRAIEEEKNGFTQALLFFADRAEHVEELKRNSDKIILCDRYVYSTYAYQGAQLERSMGVDKAIEWFERVYEPFRYDPDLVILITVDPEEGLRRIYGRNKKERFERLDFLKRVQEIYLYLADRYHFVIVDGDRHFEKVYSDIRKIVLKNISQSIRL